MKNKIKGFAKEIGTDDVGIAAIADYQSPRSPSIEKLFPEAKSIVVLAFRELSNCESPSPQIAMSGRLDLMDFLRRSSYRMARFLETDCGAKAMTVPATFPMEMSRETKGLVADLSLRHAAVAAGLGTFGRNNLVYHPRFKNKVIFSAVLTDLGLESDPPAQGESCSRCNRCVEHCPAGALHEEGKTDVMKCMRTLEPYGLGASIQFWTKLMDASPEEKKVLLRDVEYWRLYHVLQMGFQYLCFNCMKSCPDMQKM
ncbi:MAG: 4Fe-4S binding protein [Syntrophorhabdaceae bacterium]|nr:4Fe-4S binding protein [Syntrophorhabdaceae bacterium]MDD5242583.1 4Fe-4S binding protein [Syntrophorhabdaceae bacterium]